MVSLIEVFFGGFEGYFLLNTWISMSAINSTQPLRLKMWERKCSMHGTRDVCSEISLKYAANYTKLFPKDVSHSSGPCIEVLEGHSCMCYSHGHVSSLLHSHSHFLLLAFSSCWEGLRIEILISKDICSSLLHF